MWEGIQLDLLSLTGAKNAEWNIYCKLRKEDSLSVPELYQKSRICSLSSWLTLFCRNVHFSSKEHNCLGLFKDDATGRSYKQNFLAFSILLFKLLLNKKSMKKNYSYRWKKYSMSTGLLTVTDNIYTDLRSSCAQFLGKSIDCHKKSILPVRKSR